MSLQLSKKVTRHVSDELRAVLTQLNPDDIETVVTTSGGTVTFAATEGEAYSVENINRFRKFVKMDLVTSMSNEELEQYRKDNNETVRNAAGFITTDLYDQLHTFLVKLVPEVLSELKLDEPVAQTKKK